MRITCISDTHGNHRRVKLPEGDMLIHAGDFTRMGRRAEVLSFFSWFSRLPYAHKICIAGNHELIADEEPLRFRRMIPSNVIYLQNEGVVVNGIKIWGSPMTPFFYDLAFNAGRGEHIGKFWRQIPGDVDILVTHGPPFGILDSTENREQAGCADLLSKVYDIQPKMHVFGHIHESYGYRRNMSTLFVNACLSDTFFRPANKPIPVSYDAKGVDIVKEKDRAHWATRSFISMNTAWISLLSPRGNESSSRKTHNQ